MEPDDLIHIARRSVDPSANSTQSELNRAVSHSYYATFHTVTNDCADLLVGSTPEARDRDEWEQAYRALDHAQVKRQCRHPDVLRYHTAIREFAKTLAELQDERHKADYSPRADFTRERVEVIVNRAASVIAAYRAVPEDERRYFMVYLALRHRRR